MLRTTSVLCLGSSAQHLLWKPFQMSLWRIRNLSGGGKAVVSTPPMDSWTGDPGNVVNSKVFTDLKIWVCFGTLANRASALNWICWTFSRCRRLGQGGYCNTLWACDSRLLISATSSSPFHSTERTALGASHVSFSGFCMPRYGNSTLPFKTICEAQISGCLVVFILPKCPSSQVFISGLECSGAGGALETWGKPRNVFISGWFWCRAVFSLDLIKSK